MIEKPATILLVEDNSDDATLLIEIFKELKLANQIDIVKDGHLCLEYLKFNSPEIIILDYKLPRMNGIEVLKAIREDERTKAIPVIMMTTTDDIDIRNEFYLNSGNSFIKKPPSLSELMECILSLSDFWFKVVLLPNTE